LVSLISFILRILLVLILPGTLLIPILISALSVFLRIVLIPLIILVSVFRIILVLLRPLLILGLTSLLSVLLTLLIFLIPLIVLISVFRIVLRIAILVLCVFHDVII